MSEAYGLTDMEGKWQGVSATNTLQQTYGNVGGYVPPQPITGAMPVPETENYFSTWFHLVLSQSIQNYF